MVQVFSVTFTKQMYLINRDPGGFPEMGLLGSSASLGRLPGHRAAGPAQAPPCSGYSLKASPPFHLYLGGGEGSGQGSAQYPCFAPHRRDRLGLIDWGGLWGRRKPLAPDSDQLQQGLDKGRQPGWGAVSLGQRLLAMREREGRIPESSGPPPYPLSCLPARQSGLSQTRPRRAEPSAGQG